MKKQYNPEIKKEIEHVLAVFQDYIRASSHFDVLWSDKMGYIYMSVDMVRGLVADIDSWVVESPERLFDKLLYELAVDIMEEAGHSIDPKEASELERVEVERRLKQYTDLLPDYQDRVQRVFSRTEE